MQARHSSSKRAVPVVGAGVLVLAGLALATVTGWSCRPSGELAPLLVDGPPPAQLSPGDDVAVDPRCGDVVEFSDGVWLFWSEDELGRFSPKTALELPAWCGPVVCWAIGPTSGSVVVCCGGETPLALLLHAGGVRACRAFRGVCNAEDRLSILGFEGLRSVLVDTLTGARGALESPPSGTPLAYKDVDGSVHFLDADRRLKTSTLAREPGRLEFTRGALRDVIDVAQVQRGERVVFAAPDSTFRAVESAWVGTLGQSLAGVCIFESDDSNDGWEVLESTAEVCCIRAPARHGVTRMRGGPERSVWIVAEGQEGRELRRDVDGGVQLRIVQESLQVVDAKDPSSSSRARLDGAIPGGADAAVLLDRTAEGEALMAVHWGDTK